MVACPGRLIDHLTCGNVSLDRIETLVLDEADRMLDMGFIPQIRRILSRLPSERQNCMYSATMPAEVDRLVLDYFGEAELVQVGNRSQAPSTITHRFESTHASDKLELLKRLLRKRSGRVLIFVKTKVRAEELGRKLKATGLPADSIHGDKSAESRHVVLQAFSRGKTRFMVATDVAARGIDVTDIELVVNCDMPKVLEDYVHRVGRTGRAGSEGEALSLVTRLDSGAAETDHPAPRRDLRPAGADHRRRGRGQVGQRPPRTEGSAAPPGARAGPRTRAQEGTAARRPRPAAQRLPARPRAPRAPRSRRPHRRLAGPAQGQAARGRRLRCAVWRRSSAEQALSVSILKEAGVLRSAAGGSRQVGDGAQESGR